MSEVKWIKIVTDIFDDEKILLIESMPEADSIIVIWFKLLCLAGKNNNNGVFLLNERIHYTDEMFATIFRRNINTVRLALKTFEQFGMIEVINDTVTIPNWGKHQKLDALEAKTNYQREYMREYRKKQRALADGESNDNANRKTNDNTNVSALDKNRLDNNRLDNSNSLPNDAAENRNHETVEAYAQNNLQYMTPTHREELISFMDDMEPELIRYAVDKACENGKRTWAYTKGVLNGLLANGIKTVGEAKAADDARRKKNAQPSMPLPDTDMSFEALY